MDLPTAFLVSQGSELGLTTGRMRAAAFQRPYRGVRSIELDISTLHGRCAALQPLMGRSHVFSHVTAALLWGLPLPWALEHPDRPLDVSALERTRMRITGVIGHELPPGIPIRRLRGGLLVTAPAITWCHLAAEAAHKTRAKRIPVFHHDLVALGDALVSGERRRDGSRTVPLCTPSELIRAVGQHGSRRGARALDDALPRVRGGVDSPQETRLRLAIVDAGLPEPEIGTMVRTPTGVFYLDLAYPEKKIAMEYEGDHHRSDRAQWRRDFLRVRALQDAGWLVVRVNADDLADPAANATLISSLRRAIAARV